MEQASVHMGGYTSASADTHASGHMSDPAFGRESRQTAGHANTQSAGHFSGQSSGQAAPQAGQPIWQSPAYQSGGFTRAAMIERIVVFYKDKTFSEYQPE
jgi:hypothetical protein